MSSAPAKCRPASAVLAVQLAQMSSAKSRLPGASSHIAQPTLIQIDNPSHLWGSNPGGTGSGQVVDGMKPCLLQIRPLSDLQQAEFHRSPRVRMSLKMSAAERNGETIAIGLTVNRCTSSDR